MIHNPIIRGFNPDPTVIRIGGDYYIAASTFEWWPGISVYHSKDLKHWRLHSRPLDKKELLDLTGVPDGGGVWAPDLSYDGERIYLVYTNVRERGPMMVTDNYLITAKSMDGPWEGPVYLNSMGFDPSLFHDRDGRKWLVSLDNHYGKNQRFNGLYIQEYDPAAKKLTGRLRLLYREPHGELVEGSHLYHINGKYYLLKAQGGTGERHSAQLSRSDSIFGPWEDCPFILMHSRDNAKLPLQKAGHADLVDTPSGELYMVHLAARYSSPGHCFFGRETCVQRVEWTPDGWLRLRDGGENPHVDVPEPVGVMEHIFPPEPAVYDFAKGVFPDCFQSLRRPLGKDMELTAEGLRLRGGDGLNSLFDQSLVARRIDRARVRITATLSFDPDCEKHMAGLVLLYDTRHWHYLYITRCGGVKQARVLSCDENRLSYPGEPVTVGEEGDIVLWAEIDGAELRFYCGQGEAQSSVGGALDMNILTDEHVFLGFTGAMAGLCCQDMLYREKWAAFRQMRYEYE